ncbi:MAG: hypothetical protein JNJ58_13015 [Chitinophagaceae bacterium]|nr:hypothetical protein [Chitinophagaceae bacterium]
MKKIVFWIILISILPISVNAQRNFFADMPEIQYFYTYYFQSSLGDSSFTKAGYIIYLSKTPAFQKNGIPYFSFYFAQMNDYKHDTVYLSKRHDTIFVSVFDNRENLNASKFITNSWLDLKHFRFLNSDNNKLSLPFSIFGYGYRFKLVNKIKLENQGVQYKIRLLQKPGVYHYYNFDYILISENRGFYYIEYDFKNAYPYRYNFRK